MSRTLVVVTCERDKWEFELLCNSMEKFLEPCKVLFVYNENQELVKPWTDYFEKKLRPKLTKFDVKIMYKSQFWTLNDECHLTDLEKEGHVDQQVIKLGVSKYITTNDYIVFDAKNFFIAPCYIEQIGQIIPEPTDWCEPILKNWITTCIETFNLTHPISNVRLTQNTTPYIFNATSARNLLKYFGDTVSLYKWFTIEARKDKHCIAEFFLYEMFTIRHGGRNLGSVKQNSITLWEHMATRDKWKIQDYVNHINHMKKYYEIYVAGLHKGLRKHLTAHEIKFLLSRLGVQDILPDIPIPFTGELQKETI